MGDTNTPTQEALFRAVVDMRHCALVHRAHELYGALSNSSRPQATATIPAQRSAYQILVYLQ
jgi:hypothetical protein